MLFKSDIIELVAAFLKERDKEIPIVLDPVTLAKSGDPLLLPEAVHTLTSQTYAPSDSSHPQST